MPNPKDDPKIHCPKCGVPRVSFTSGMIFGAHKRHCDGGKQSFKIDTASIAKSIESIGTLVEEQDIKPTLVRRILIEGKLIEGVVMNGWFYPFQDETR